MELNFSLKFFVLPEKEAYIRIADQMAFRTPRDDAPPYDPSLWEDRDNAFITRLVLQRSADAAAALNNTNLSAAATVPPPAQPELAAVNHTLGASLPNRTYWDKLRNYFFPHTEPVPLATAVRQASIEDLTLRLQAALAAGDVGLAGTVSAELATRRVHLKSGSLFLPQDTNLASAQQSPASAQVLEPARRTMISRQKQTHFS
jgi:hypothetical protein